MIAERLLRPSLLVTSPLRRTVQTMSVAFADALDAGVPAVAHELCREAFHGTDPSIYDSRLGREKLAATFPRVDFMSYVLPAEQGEAPGGPPVDDPLWWHCDSPFGDGGGAPHGMTEAAIAEHAYQFLAWLMARPEPVIAVATHCNFLLALHHGVLDGTPDAPQVFHTGELRAVRISARAHEARVRQYAMFGTREARASAAVKGAADDSPCCVHSGIDPLAGSAGRAGGGDEQRTSTLPLGCDIEVDMQPAPLAHEIM